MNPAELALLEDIRDRLAGLERLIGSVPASYRKHQAAEDLKRKRAFLKGASQRAAKQPRKEQ